MAGTLACWMAGAVAGVVGAVSAVGVVVVVVGRAVSVTVLVRWVEGVGRPGLGGIAGTVALVMVAAFWTAGGISHWRISSWTAALWELGGAEASHLR